MVTKTNLPTSLCDISDSSDSSDRSGISESSDSSDQEIFFPKQNEPLWYYDTSFTQKITAPMTTQGLLLQMVLYPQGA